MALTRLSRELTHFAMIFKIDRGLYRTKWIDRIPGEPGECHSPLRDPSFSIAFKTKYLTKLQVDSIFVSIQLLVWECHRPYTNDNNIRHP